MSNEQLLQAISDIMEEKLEEKLDQKLEEKLEQKLEEKLEQKLEEKLEEKLDQKFDEKLLPIYSRLDKLESETSALRVGQAELRKDVKELSMKVSETYQLALEAWGTSVENRKWLETS